MTKNVDLETALIIQCQGTLKKGFHDYFDSGFGNWLPGEPDEIEEFAVYATFQDGNTIDVTERITPKEYEQQYASYLRKLIRDWDSQ